MLSKIVAVNASRLLPLHTSRVVVGAATSRYFSIHSELAKKEKVEEDRYIREQDHRNYVERTRERKRADAVAQMAAEEQALRAEMDAAMNDVLFVLSKTGEENKLTDGAIKNLASKMLGK